MPALASSLRAASLSSIGKVLASETIRLPLAIPCAVASAASSSQTAISAATDGKEVRMCPVLPTSMRDDAPTLAIRLLICLRVAGLTSTPIT